MAETPEDPLDRLDRLLSQQEKAVRDAFAAFLASVSSGTVAEQIIVKLEARDLEGAMQIIDSYIERMGDVIPRVSSAVGAATADELAAVMADAVPDMATGIGFDSSHPRAAQIVRNHRAALVRYVSTEQRRAIQQSINRALNGGKTLAGSAREFRDAVGLTAYQEQVVANYRTQLENLDRKALDRELRDRRRDPTIERAIERKRPLTDQQVDSMVDQYRARMLAMRGDNIARTEALQAFSEARDESLAQMLDQTGLEIDRVVERWNATRDLNTRGWHARMDGQERKIGEPFVDGLGNSLRYPGDPRAPANTRINCRCTKTFSVQSSA